MIVNLTKIVRYRPLTKSAKGIDRLKELAEYYGLEEVEFRREFTLFLAYLVRRHIQNAVKTQKIGGVPMKLKYRPLNKKYNKSKPKSSQDKFWVNTDFLIKNLKVWQLKNGDVYIGYRFNNVHKNFKKGKNGRRVKARDIMVWLEKGTKKIPPRPLFSVIVRNIAKNISFYLDMFHRNIQKGIIKL